MLDRQITSFPFIDFRDYSRGIDPINGAEITGLDSIDAAKGIAASLRTSVLSHPDHGFPRATAGPCRSVEILALQAS